ncbi:hypothetical protein EDC27_2750 [Desulfosoma caldarium]|uniref:Uncharacterized protein n=1 Tax=Desulfosoma caldarium TaxID=610254 RepID=A0A3N1UK31_9BACT|nr:hypothetical protein EDC27_2750 [Desulfosoma caldarium]
MPHCGLCGAEAPPQPCVTEKGQCDLWGRKAVLAEDKNKEKTEKCACSAPHSPCP